MNTEEKELLLQKYLLGEMSEVELEQIEKLKKEDMNFAAEVEDYNKIVDGMKGLSMDQFKQELHNWEKAYQAKRGNLKAQQFPFSFPRYYQIAAVLLLLLVSVLVILMLRAPSTTSNNELYAQYYEPYEDLIIDRAQDPQSTPTQLYQGMDAYKQQNFQEAIIYLKAYLSDFPDELIPRLYLGISLLEEDNVNEAIGQFQQLLSSPELRQQAQWYTALAYLKGNKTDLAKDMFEEIIHDSLSHYKSQEAEELLQSIP